MNRRIGFIIDSSAQAIHKNYQLSKESTQEIKKEIKEIMEMAYTI